MNELVVVDFSRVSRGLKLVARAQELAVERENAAVAKDRTEAAVKIIAYSAAACALVIVSVGVAIWLARQRHVVEIRQPAPPQRETIAPLPPTAPQSTPPAIPPNKIKTNVSQFNSVERADLKFHNPYMSRLTAGHRFSTSNADAWEAAWCYADFHRDGLAYTLWLENRMGSTNIPTSTTDEVRRRLEITDEDVRFLRERCPWKPR